ncbi:hypothetical protein RB195_008961 [Necator americanus]|uniref:Uncharacterized protein n=1 Tax=Necator americanus TaxID=51031 RepID=A0ABR1CR77_NECAM
MMYGSETWAAPSTVMERLDCTERKLLRRLLGYFWPRVCHNEDLYAEIDVVYQRMTRGRYQHLAPPSKAAKVNRLCFFGHELRRPADRLVQRVLRSSLGSVRSHLAENGSSGLRIWNSDEWIDSVQALEKVGQSCVQRQHTTAKMRVIASGHDISPPIKSSKRSIVPEEDELFLAEEEVNRRGDKREVKYTERNQSVNSDYEEEYVGDKSNNSEGLPQDQNDPMRQKVMGGVKALKGELPWAVYINLPFETYAFNL